MTTPGSRVVVSRTLRSRGDCGDDALNLMMICCEERAPYGPAADTANMFLELLCAAYERHRIRGSVAEEESGGGGNGAKEFDYTIGITLYHAQSMDYPKTPQEWDGYDGIIIPGSFSAAYDTHVEWIRCLLKVIQKDIHDKQRKALGVCFGHQVFAHSFGFACDGHEGTDGQISSNDNGENDQQQSTSLHEGGRATKCSGGPIVGRKSFKLTAEGKFLLRGSPYVRRDQTGDQLSQPASKDCLDMLYTRGDMVKSLPSVAVALCGNGDFPNEVCAYFATKEDALQFRKSVDQGHHFDSPASGTYVTSAKQFPGCNDDMSLPYAITFQAHPEYMSPHGVQNQICQLRQGNGKTRCNRPRNIPRGMRGC